MDRDDEPVDLFGSLKAPGRPVGDNRPMWRRRMDRRLAEQAARIEAARRKRRGGGPPKAVVESGDDG